MSNTPRVTIHLDAIRLDELCAFYADLLGYRVTDTEHPGLLNEVRTLESDRYPHLRLQFHNCHPRPPMASARGTIRALEFEVDDPVETTSRIANPRWITPLPGADEPESDRLILQDSTGYHVALVRRQGDSACTDANRP